MSRLCGLRAHRIYKRAQQKSALNSVLISFMTIDYQPSSLAAYLPENFDATLSQDPLHLRDWFQF